MASSYHQQQPHQTSSSHCVEIAVAEVGPPPMAIAEIEPIVATAVELPLVPI